MPVSHSIDFVDGIVIVSFKGRITAGDIYDGLSALFSDKHWQLDFPHLWDASNITKLDIDFNELMKIHDLIGGVINEGRKVTGKSAVVVSNRVTYLFARSMYAFYSWYKPFRVFRDVQSAIAWIYLSPAEHFPCLKDDKRAEISEPRHIEPHNRGPFPRV